MKIRGLTETSALVCVRLLTLWLSDHVPGTVCEDAVGPLPGVHVDVSQELLSGHRFGIHGVLLDLCKQMQSSLKSGGFFFFF